MTDPTQPSSTITLEDRERADRYVRFSATGFERILAFWKANLPDSQKQPITSGLVAAYVSRMELQMGAMQLGINGVLEQAKTHPKINAEARELAGWVESLEPENLHPKVTDENEDAYGDAFVSQWGFSYSETRSVLRGQRKLPKGAPNKRAHTLKMMDARIVNGLSYAKLANKMCDCELMTHSHLCRERIRKRIKELETVLSKYSIPSCKKRRK